MFNRLDQYLSKIFLTYFFSGLVVLLCLFLVIDFMTQVTQYDVPLSTIAKYCGAYSFEILYQFMPVGALVGVVFTLSNLNKTHELTALYVMGLSLFRILVPIFFWIFLFVGFSFFIGDRVIPVTKKKKDYIKYVEMQKKPDLFFTVKTNKIWYRSQDIIFNIKFLDPENKTAHGVTFYYLSPSWKLRQVITAQKALVKDLGWELSDGTITLFVEDFSTPLVKSFATKTIAMNEDFSDIQTASAASDFLSFGELGEYIDKNKEAGLNMTSFEVNYHNKLSFPFTILVMALIGIPFVISHQRSGGMAKNVGLILLLTLGFWLLYSSSMSMGRHGQLPPLLATWGPNLMMMGACFFSFRWTRA